MTTHGAELSATLLESDRRYFELGAHLSALAGGVVACMPGIEATAGGAVVHRIRPEEIAGDLGEWVQHATGTLADMGCSAARMYLDEPAPELEAALATAGFRRRVEIGYVAHGRLPDRDATARSRVSLRPVRGDSAWEAKRKLHAGSDVAADGHATPADDWVELERRKCDSGHMDAFLVEVDGEVCGGIATLDCGPLLRAKNVFVHPDRRREGIAAQAMRVVSRRASELGKEATGIFGVDGNPGNAVYLHLAMTPVVTQFEWAKTLRP